MAADNNTDNTQPDRDMKLTAYALDELDQAGRREVEERLADDQPARREVEQIRATAALLREQLAAEPMPGPASSPTLVLPRRLSWRARVAVAAAVAVVVGGVAFSIRTPSLNRAREVASPARLRSGPINAATADETIVGIGAGNRSPQQAAAEKKVPYDDILRYPANWPDVSQPRQQVQQQAATPSARPNFTNGPTFNLQQANSEGQQNGQFGGLPSDSLQRSKDQSLVAEGEVAAARRADDSTRYSYQNSYPGTNTAAGFGLDNSVGAEFAVTGDINPGASPSTFNTEAYDRVVDNRFLEVAQNPLSTFSIDVDTASYANLRRFLSRGQVPPKDSVRIEELVNYFPYDYAPPKKKSPDPFAAYVEVAACPWKPEHRLVRVGLKGKEIAADKRPASNLVFLLDVSGSMNSANKLPLVKRSMRMLLEQLNGEDRVAIVVYAGSSGLALPSTPCTDREKESILNAIESLSAGGSTNGEQGIQLAYTVAQKHFIDGGTNRVILCTDGDFNVGVTSQGDLTRTIEEKAKSGVFLSVLGFGMGNLKDSTMEKLADKGNGNYGYIDTINEAKKLLVEQMSGTLITIAKDVKIQIEFNPAVVGAYRLIGYENRMLAKEDFNDDRKDAGEIGAGHAVTALYEVVPAGKAIDAPAVDELKYQEPATAPQRLPQAADHASDEMLTLKLRYKQPDGDTSKLIEVPVKDGEKSFDAASVDFKFASAVAAFGMVLRDSPHKGSATIDAALGWAEAGLGDDAGGYRQEFVDLIKRSRAVAPDLAR